MMNVPEDAASLSKVKNPATVIGTFAFLHVSVTNDPQLYGVSKKFGIFIIVI